MDKSERLLSDIASSVSTLALYAGSEFDSTTIEGHLEQISDRLAGIQDALERQIGVLYELREDLKD